MRRKPRVLPSLVIAPVAMVPGVFVGILAVLLYVVLKQADPTQLGAPEVLLTVIPTELAFIGAALLGARLSPVPLRQRLGLGAPKGPIWALPFMALATLAILFASGVLNEALFDEPPPQIVDLMDRITSATGPLLAALIVSLTVLPALGEELVIRGFMQRRLIRRWGPALGIFVSSVMFAAIHIDPRHAIGVFPIGVWMGVVAWRTGSVWPAVACHFVNNLAALGLTIMSARGVDDSVLIAMPIVGAVSLVIAMVGLVLGPGDASAGRA